MVGIQARAWFLKLVRGPKMQFYGGNSSASLVFEVGAKTKNAVLWWEFKRELGF